MAIWSPQIPTGGGFGDWFSPIINAGADIINDSLNRAATEEENKKNREHENQINSSNQDLTREMNEKNLALQREMNAQAQNNWQSQFDYQKSLNSLVMNREDNAIQRRVKDLQAAGINKLMAVGGDGAGASTQTTFGGSANLGVTEAKAHQNQAIYQHKTWKTQMLQGIANAMLTGAQVSQTQAQTRLINNQAESEKYGPALKQSVTNLNNALKDKNYKEIEKIAKEIDTIIHNLNTAKNLGTPTGMLPSNWFQSVAAGINKLSEGDSPNTAPSKAEPKKKDDEYTWTKPPQKLKRGKGYRFNGRVFDTWDDVVGYARKNNLMWDGATWKYE